MAIQSARATVFRVTRIAPLSMSQLNFASILFSFRSGGCAGNAFGLTGSTSTANIRASPQKVPLTDCELGAGCRLAASGAETVGLEEAGHTFFRFSRTLFQSGTLLARNFQPACSVSRGASSGICGGVAGEFTCPGSTSRKAHSIRSTELRISSTDLSLSAAVA